MTNLTNFIVNFLPGFSVRGRHELLQGAIGTFPEEDHAYTMVTTLMWALPIIICIAAILDIGFVYLYMKKAHPWIGILIDEEAEEAKKQKKKEKKLKKKQAKLMNVMKRHFPPEFM